MPDSLDSNKKDNLIALLRGAAGAIPFVGGLLGELLSSVIPGQRHDRIAEYLRQLNDKIDEMDQAAARAALLNAEKVALVESGGYQAARATTAQRIEKIVNVVANGLSSNDTEALRRARLLSLLGEIDDDEITILSAYGLSRGVYQHEAWSLINRPPPSHLGSERQVLDQNILYDLGKDRLLRLDLLQWRFRSPKKGQIPEFDAKTGMMKGTVEISPLGRLLLREIGVLDQSG